MRREHGKQIKAGGSTALSGKKPRLLAMTLLLAVLAGAVAASPSEAASEKNNPQQEKGRLPGIVPHAVQKYEFKQTETKPSERKTTRSGKLLEYKKNLQIEDAKKLEEEYILVLPPLSKEEIELFTSGLKELIPTVGIKRYIPNVELNWKYLGKRMIEGMKMNVWQTAVRSPEATYIDVCFANLFEPRNWLDEIVIHGYGPNFESEYFDWQTFTPQHSRSNSCVVVNNSDIAILEFAAKPEIPGPNKKKYFDIQDFGHGMAGKYFHMNKAPETDNMRFANDQCSLDVCNVNSFPNWANYPFTRKPINPPPFTPA
ncbi:MAG: hypothetical protein OEZ28_09435 [Nitrospinota bacterium]|nr:hypothetical protein [Nitrospinota bacterium]